MHNDTYNTARERQVNSAVPNLSGDYVLYWIQAYRRLDHNHALPRDRVRPGATEATRDLRGLTFRLSLGMPATAPFILECMSDNLARAAKLGLNYWPFVATTNNPGRGLLRELAARATVVVTDDYPCFVVRPALGAGAFGTVWYMRRRTRRGNSESRLIWIMLRDYESARGKRLTGSNYTYCIGLNIGSLAVSAPSR